jgi:hypothetical protein
MSDFELISDLHKDARGFRPGTWFMDQFNDLPHDEKERVWDSLVKELVENEREETIRALDAQRQFEHRINDLMTDFGINRVTAFRWTIDAAGLIDDVRRAEDSHGDASQEIEHYLWNEGIDFQLFPAYTAEILEALNQ